MEGGIKFYNDFILDSYQTLYQVYIKFYIKSISKFISKLYKIYIKKILIDN